MDGRYPDSGAVGSLAEERSSAGNLVTLFMPTQKQTSPDNVRANRIQFKNLVQKIQDQLSNDTGGTIQNAGYLKPLWDLYEAFDFWENLDYGLAVYLSPNRFEWFDLPFGVSPGAYTGSSFVMTPLVIALKATRDFYILSLNLKHPRLFLASREELTELSGLDLPGEWLKTLKISEFQEEQQFHSLGANNHGVQFHGHGSGHDNSQALIDSYLRIIDQALSDHSEIKPNDELVLAGVPSLLADFKRVSQHRNFSDIAIHGSFDGTEDNKLSAAVKELSTSETYSSSSNFSSAYAEALPSLKYSIATPSTIMNLAGEGKIKTLALRLLKPIGARKFLKTDEHFLLDFTGSEPQIFEIDKLVRNVHKHRGRVISVMSDAKSDFKIQAILRYAS